MKTGYNLISIERPCGRPGTIRAEFVSDNEFGHLDALFGSDVDSIDAPEQIPAGSCCASVFIGPEVRGYPSAHWRHA